MAAFKPLVFDSDRGMPRRMTSGEALLVPGDLALSGGVAFNGQAVPVAVPSIQGDWGQSLADLISALVLLGLLRDQRVADWTPALRSAVALSLIGPHQVGRLMVGSAAGWRSLDQPALVDGVLQALVAHSGALEADAGGGQSAALAYAPVVAYAPVEPVAAVKGTLWFNSSNGALQIRGSSGWVEVLRPPVDATTSVKGIVELATAQEVADGSDAVRAVTPASLKPQLDLKAPLLNPQFSGVPSAPTAAAGTRTTQLATTQFVLDALQQGVGVIPPATDTSSGVVELATAQETAAGQDNTRAVTPAALKPQLDLKASLDGPAFSGAPSAPTPPGDSDSTRLATTAFVQQVLRGGLGSLPDATESVKGLVELATDTETAIGADTARAVTPAALKPLLEQKAPLNSPALSGAPSAPTPALGNDSNLLATTAFVARALRQGASVTIADAAPNDAKSGDLWWDSTAGVGRLFVFFVDGDSSQWVDASPANGGNREPPPSASDAAPVMAGAASAGVAATYSRADHRHPTDSSRAPVDSPVFTGVPTAPTAGAGTSTTQLATTAFVASGFLAKDFTLLPLLP